MKYNYIRNLFVLVVSLFSIACSAKNKDKVVIDTISFKELTDISARVHSEYDSEGNPCALIKVYSPLIENLRFQGDAVVKETKVDNEKWIWVRDRSSKLTLLAKNMEPRTIVLSDYGYPRLHAKTTYQLNITVGHERETTVYKDIDIHKIERKNKYVDSYKYDKDKVYWFLMYQCQSGSALGFNIGVCVDFGFYLSYNHYDGGFFDFLPDANEPCDMSTFMGGTMFRLTPYLYLQTGLGFSYEPLVGMHFVTGANLLFRIKRFIVGCGYNYNHMSVSYNRNVFFDGITAQLGLNF
ncbi:MAG: hypothetical protein K2L45_07980 [Muribaculaceae bacterium]|nr:hypothetical protein [Muribaculaceae bacterium]